MIEIDKQLKDGQEELTKLADTIKMYDAKKLPARKIAQIDDEQYKLQFKLKELELQGLEKKLESYKKVIEIIHE